MRRAQAEERQDSGAPMVEIFGGIFALLLVMFLIINLFSQAALEERLESASESGLYRIGWGASGEGFVVIAFPEELRIIETGETVSKGEICAPGSVFINYANKVYRAQGRQLIFSILENSVSVMAEARNCMRRIMPGQRLSIGWIIANDELLKAVSLDDIPPYIKKAVN